MAFVSVFTNKKYDNGQKTFFKPKPSNRLINVGENTNNGEAASFLIHHSPFTIHDSRRHMFPFFSSLTAWSAALAVNAI
jgi:hypothetical protein